MDKDQILDIKIPNNEKVRHYLSLKYLDGVYSETKEFDSIAAKIASRFPVNSLIKAKIDKRESYLESWQKLCTRLFYYLLGPAKFFDRKDANSLVCLPICCKISINGTDYPTWAINVYNSEKRIVTVFHKDPELDNNFSFYTDKLVAKGSWVGEVRTAVQQFNLYGLNVDLKSIGSSSGKNPTEAFSALSRQESAVYGNTITVYDIFKKIESIKQKL